MTRTVTRVATLPIRAVSAPDGARLDLFDVFRHAWRLSTDLANWCQRELTTHDVRRQPGDVKLGKFDRKCLPGGSDLYGHVNRACPFRGEFNGAAGSLSAITKAVEDTWKGHPLFGRYAVLWEGKASACVFRYPYPWPVRGQEIRGQLFRDSGDPCVSLPIPGGRAVVRLAAGPEFRRQLAQFDFLASNPDRVCAAKVTARFKCGKLVGADLRLVGQFNVIERGPAPNVMFLHTDPAALLVAEVNGRPVTVTNGDHIKRAMKVITTTNERHKVWLQRAGEDKKREVRMDRRQRANLEQKVDARCDKQRKRIDTAVKQIARQVLRVCERQGVGLVAYDDTRREYIPHGFDWSALKTRMRSCFVEEMGGEWIDGEYVFLNPQERASWLVEQRAKAAAEAGRRALAHAKRKSSHPKVSKSPARSRLLKSV